MGDMAEFYDWGERDEEDEHYHESCRECDGDPSLIRNSWCLRCMKRSKGGVE